MSWPLFSLVLASATGGALLALGSLPVRQLRELAREPVKAAAAWTVVAVTAPLAVFHWYLIFAICALIAWTRLDRPAGKIWLALTAALGLSLGIVFPLVASPDLLPLESPLALVALYLGGASMGLAYAVTVLARAGNHGSAPAFGRTYLLVTVAWTVLLGFALLRLTKFPRPLVLTGHGPPLFIVNAWTPLLPALALVGLAFLAWQQSRRGNLRPTGWLALAGCGLAFFTSLLAQFVLRASDLPPLLAPSKPI